MMPVRAIGFFLIYMLGATAQAADWRTEVTGFGDRLVAQGAVPGMGVAVVRGDQIVYRHGFGIADLESGRTVDNDTYFYIASSTKALTATAVTLEAARHELDLSAPITDYLPELKGTAWDTQRVTLDDLLAMRDGMKDRWPVVFRTAYSGDFTRSKLIELLKDYEPAEHGKTFEYTNLDYNLLGLVLGRKGKNSWKQAVEREVLIPLQMSQTSADLSALPERQIALPHTIATSATSRIPLLKADANLHAAGGHFSTASSLARFVAAQISGGIVDGKRLLPAGPLRQTQTQHARQDRQFGDYHRTGWGYGWDIGDYDGERLLHRFGSFGGYRAHMSFMPDRSVGVVVLANANTPAVDLMASYIYAQLLERHGASARFTVKLKQFEKQLAAYRAHYQADMHKRQQRAAPLAHPLEAFTGTFENAELGTMDWYLGKTGLEVRAGIAHSRAEIYNAADNAFRIEVTGSGSVAHFLFDKSGHVSGVRFLDRVFAKRP
ncbi:serine hydrolase domain-containing protein [Microbulbifer sp. SAOS-129_SWC]|uniref:serine hydrolase domain-containing protein n=1 Tax=Microbulbifer sp. SAOS-129_SWC TaxID=3145235 RepID=UPI003216A4D7